jgi:hypothetical protein
VWITEGITAVKQLGSIAGSVLKTFQGIVSAAQSVGGGTLGGLAAVMKSIATTVNGPAFQTGLRQFFTGLQAGFARCRPRCRRSVRLSPRSVRRSLL